MKARHVWANSWPGNYCKRCGIDAVMEAAICCPKCYVPCDAEEEARDPVIKLCPEHQVWADTPCIQTALIPLYSIYGLETLGLLHELHHLAMAYVYGWMHATGDEFPDYTDVRDYLLIHAWDMRYENACQVALHVTEHISGRVALLHDDEPHVSEFKPIL